METTKYEFFFAIKERIYDPTWTINSKKRIKH